MALDIAPPNFAGLAAVASGGGNLNLPAPGALGLQALQQNQVQRASQQQAALELAKIRAMELQGLRENRTAQQGLQQQGVYQQGLLQNQQAGIQQDALSGMMRNQFDAAKFLQEYQQKDAHKSSDIDVEHKKLAVDVLKQQMDKLKEDKKEVLQEKGAFAAHILLALDQAKTPEQAIQIRAEALKSGLANGYITKEEAAAASRMSNSQFRSSVEFKALQFEAASQYKQLKEATGGSTVTLPDGTVIQTESPTKAVETEVQKDLIKKEKSLKQTEFLRNNYHKKYFTYPGQAENLLSVAAEKTKGIPLVGTILDKGAEKLSGLSKEDRAKAIQEAQTYKSAVLQFFFDYQHEISGAAVSETEVERLKQAVINGDMSPSEFLGALEYAESKNKSDTEINKNVLNNGVNTDSLYSRYRNHPDYKDWSEAEIREAMKNAP